MAVHQANNGMRSRAAWLAAACGLAFAGATQAATFAGNGANGFGGPVGQGNLTITDAVYTDPNTLATSPGVNFTFVTSASHPSGLDGNNLVVYLSTGAPGLTDTQSLIDVGTPPNQIDFGRVAISGYNNFSQNPATRTVIAFPTGFQATYAFSLANAYDGLFKLPTDNSGILQYVNGSAPVNGNVSVTVPLSDLGLTAGQGFSFVATYLDGSAAYRSNETIGGPATLNNGPDLATQGNPGFNNLITFTGSSSFTTAVPEPAAVAGVAGLAGLLARRRGR